MTFRTTTKRGFTLLELAVAVGTLAVVLSLVGVIFRVSIEAHRVSSANSEIMQKLRAITDQLNRDFRGLRRDAEIFAAWVARYDTDADKHIRFDRIMFFADGDFYTYDPPYPGYSEPQMRGNLARVTYMLANKSDGAAWQQQPHQQRPSERILIRSQHILTSEPDPGLVALRPDPGTLTPIQMPTWLHDWQNASEFDRLTLAQWMTMPWLKPMKLAKANMLSAITDVRTDPTVPNPHIIGSRILLEDIGDSNTISADSIHMILCEGVGEFAIQGWHEQLQRWVPMVDPNGDGILADSDFFLDAGGEIDPNRVPGVLYPRSPGHHGGVSLGGGFELAATVGNVNSPYYFEQDRIRRDRFNEIPGLGRALKFTFRLYDSKGVIKNGRKFTYMVYLDD